MKTFFRILGIVAAVLVVLFFVVRAQLDPQALGERVLTKVNEQPGVKLQAERFEIGILRGLVLEQATLEATSDSGTTSAHLERLVLDYQLLPVLRGDLIVDRILIEAPHIDVVTREAAAPSESSSRGSREGDPAEPPAAPESPESGGFLSTLTIAELHVTDGALTARSEGAAEPELTIEGLEISLTDFRFDTTAEQPIRGLSGVGSLRLAHIAAGDLDLEGGRGELVLAQGVATITGLAVKEARADLQVDRLEADLAQESVPFELSAAGTLDLDALLEAEGDGSFGDPSLALEISGQGPDPDLLVGGGTLTIPDGTLPSIAVLELIERLLGGPAISGEPYEGANVRFELAGGVVAIQPFELGLESLRLSAGGNAHLDGPLDMVATASLPRESVGNSVLDPFVDALTDENGWTTVPFEIGGTLEGPSVDPDFSAVKDAAIDSGKRALTGLIDRELGKLLDRGKKKDG